jgi:hypothetical protein
MTPPKVAPMLKMATVSRSKIRGKKAPALAQEDPVPVAALDFSGVSDEEGLDDKLHEQPSVVTKAAEKPFHTSRGPVISHNSIWASMMTPEYDDDDAASSSSDVAEPEPEESVKESAEQASLAPSRKSPKAKKSKAKKNNSKQAKACDEDIDEALLECDHASKKNVSNQKGNYTVDAIVPSAAVAGNIAKPTCCLICQKAMHANTLARRVGLCKTHFREMQQFEKTLAEMHETHFSMSCLEGGLLHCFARTFWTLPVHHSHLKDNDKGVAFYKCLAHFLIARDEKNRGEVHRWQNISGATPFQLAVDIIKFAPQAVVALAHAVQQSGGHLSVEEAAQCAFAEEELATWSPQTIQPLWDDTSRNMALMAYWQQMSAEWSARPRVLCIPEDPRLETETGIQQEGLASTEDEPPELATVTVAEMPE